MNSLGANNFYSDLYNKYNCETKKNSQMKTKG